MPHIRLTIALLTHVSLRPGFAQEPEATAFEPRLELPVDASKMVSTASSLESTSGGKTDFRGYPSGRYRDRMMYALQGEIRWQVSDRWVFTGFAGFGEVADRFGDMGDDILPAAGIGARFMLSTKHDVGLSTDIAFGNDGTEFYFGAGEAF